MLGKFSKIYIDSIASMESLFLNQSISDNNSSKVKGLFEQMNENYLLGIKRVVISEKVDRNPQEPISDIPVSTPRNRPTVGSSPKEVKKANDCVIKIVAEVWSVKEKKKVAEFTSIGESKIILMMYGRALQESLESSVSNLVNYIEENNE